MRKGIGRNHMPAINNAYWAIDFTPVNGLNLFTIYTAFTSINVGEIHGKTYSKMREWYYQGINELGLCLSYQAAHVQPCAIPQRERLFVLQIIYTRSTTPFFQITAILYWHSTWISLYLRMSSLCKMSGLAGLKEKRVYQSNQGTV